MGSDHITYLTAQPTRDVAIARIQHSVRDWWRSAAARFELAVSELVVNEASAGDPEAARERLAGFVPLTLLNATLTLLPKTHLEAVPLRVFKDVYLRGVGRCFAGFPQSAAQALHVGCHFECLRVEALRALHICYVVGLP